MTFHTTFSYKLFVNIKMLSEIIVKFNISQYLLTCDISYIKLLISKATYIKFNEN